MSESEAKNSSRRARASKPKVKSGCITCKVRRVKCDETKPWCLRCQKFGRPCDGYEVVGNRPKRTSPVPIQPRPNQVTYTPSCTLPGDEQERRYYQLFCERTATDLSSYFPTEFWKRLVMRESASEPSIRHAVIALSALTKTMHHDDFVQASAADTTYQTDDHEFALKQYNKAIANLQNDLSLQGQPKIRTALVACFLFACFENISGDYEAASRQMQSGLSLLEQWQAQNPTPSRPGSPSQLDDAIDDEVFQMFARLDAQAFGHVGSEANLPPHARLLEWDTPEDKGIYIPDTFPDISAARECWDMIMKKCVHFHQASGPYRYAPLETRPKWIDAERDANILLLNQFQTSLQPLIFESHGPDGLLFDPLPTIMELCAKVSAIYLYASVCLGEMNYDMFTNEYQDIVERSVPLVELARQRGHTEPGVFAFELGIVPPLHLTALKCRVPKIRQQAISLLLSCPRQEGTWDGVLLGKVDIWLMELEEQGMDQFGFVPESARWRLAEVKSNLAERWICAKCYQDSYDMNGQWCYATNSRETRINF